MKHSFALEGHQRNGIIELWRFIFAVIVVSHHAIYLPGRTVEGYDHFVPFVGGYTAVEFFFICSGFLMAKKLYSTPPCTDMREICKHTLTEIRRKISAILSVFVVAYILSFVIRQLCVGERVETAVYNFFASFGEWTFTAMAGFLFLPHQYIGPIWYFSALVLTILLLFPVMSRYRETFSMIIAPALVLFCYGYLAMQCGNLGVTIQWEPIKGGLFRAFAGVSLGNILFVIAQYRSKTNTLSKAGVKVVLVLETVIFGVLVYFMNRYHSGCYDFLEAFLIAWLVYLSFAVETLLNRLCNNKFVYFLGRYSVALYVTHTAFVWLPQAVWPERWRYEWLMWMLLALAASLVVYWAGGLLASAVNGAMRRCKDAIYEKNG